MDDGQGRERESIRRLRGGDAAAVAPLVDTHGESLMRYLVSLIGQRSDAEDVFQETWVRVIDRIAGFDGERPFAPWLFRIARNCAFDLRRRRRFLSFFGLRSEDEPGFPEPAACDSFPDELAARQHAGRLLRALSVRQRELLALRFAAELSYEEIAAVCRVPVGTVKSRLHRALDAAAEAQRGLGGRTR